MENAMKRKEMLNHLTSTIEGERGGNKLKASASISDNKRKRGEE